MQASSVETLRTQLEKALAAPQSKFVKPLETRGGHFAIVNALQSSLLKHAVRAENGVLQIAENTLAKEMAKFSQKMLPLVEQLRENAQKSQKVQALKCESLRCGLALEEQRTDILRRKLHQALSESDRRASSLMVERCFALIFEMDAVYRRLDDVEEEKRSLSDRMERKLAGRIREQDCAPEQELAASRAQFAMYKEP